MMTPCRLLRAFIMALVLPLAPATQAGTVTTPGIIADNLGALPACFRWRIAGLCFWLRCRWFSCSIEVTTKTRHYNPDLVVSVYNDLGGHPWVDYARPVVAVAGQTAATALLAPFGWDRVDSSAHAEGREGTSSPRRRASLDYVFRDADAFGNPTLAVLAAALAGEEVIPGIGIDVGGLGVGFDITLLCPTAATAFLPYMISGLDALVWRGLVPVESLFPASLVPGLREIGHFPLNTWGGVYPRDGWTTQPQEPKAAAINAQRIGDIVTRSGQPHVYLPVGGGEFLSDWWLEIIHDWVQVAGGDTPDLLDDLFEDQWYPLFGGKKVWGPGALYEGESDTGDWQMHVPLSQHSCEVFGANDTLSLSSWSDGKRDDSGDYAWTLWRPYSCCDRGGQIFLFSVDF